jgi:hypothetical protein
VRDFGYVIYNAQYRATAQGLTEVPPEHYAPNRVMRLHTYSAVARYLYHNAAALRTRAAIRQQAVQRNDAQAAVQVADERPLLEAAAREVVRTIRTEHHDAVVLFVMDADRRTMYETGAEPAPLLESPIWAAACAELGCGYLDLTTAFWSAYRADHRPLDFPSNYHWNRRGMAAVAKAIAQWLQQAPGSPATS